MKMVILPGGQNRDEGVTSQVAGHTNKPAPGCSSSTATTGNKTGPAQPTHPALWGVVECKRWLPRHCGELGSQYTELFQKHNVTGRSLLRMNSASLERMGISNPVHRHEIWREIIKLKLKSDILEIRDLQSQLASASTSSPYK